jgi:nicotinamidase-related amidase
VEATVRYAAELGYEVSVVKDATASYSDDHMHAALENCRRSRLSARKLMKFFLTGFDRTARNPIGSGFEPGLILL